jgi:hypothetical protein
VKAPIWVQVHGLPLDRMNNANAAIIAESIGGLVEVDKPDCSKPCRKSFLRIRVLLPLEDPLPTGFLLQRPPKQPVIISYQFERLSEFCYACGRLGHLSYQCPIIPRPPENGRYGPALKARPPLANRVELLLSPQRVTRYRSSAVSSVRDQVLASPEVSSPSTVSSPISSSGGGSQPSQLNTVAVQESNPLQPGLSNNSTATDPAASAEFSPCNSPTAALNGKSSFANFQMGPVPSPSFPTPTCTQLVATHPKYTSSHVTSEQITNSPLFTTLTPLVEHPSDKTTWSQPIKNSQFPATSNFSPLNSPSESSAFSANSKPPKYPIGPLSRKRFHPYTKQSTPHSPSGRPEPLPPKKPKPDPPSPPLTTADDVSCIKEGCVTSPDSPTNGVLGFSLPPQPQ